MSITLKDKDGVDVVFNEVSRNGNSRTYICPGSTLLDTKRIILNLNEKGATNRVTGKLSVPSVGVNPSTGVSGVLWTEVGSFDLSSVLAADSNAALNFIAMFSAFVASDTVKNLYTTGV